VSAVLAHTLIEIGPEYPKVGPEKLQELAAVKRELEAQAPPGAAPDPIEAELASPNGKKAKQGA
jgi:hypothetical protein